MRTNRLVWVPLLAVLALVAWVFMPTWQFQWLSWDDPMLVSRNAHLTGLHWPALQWMFTESFQQWGHYEPLHYLALGSVMQIAGRSAEAFHILGWAIHLVNVLLVYVFSYVLAEAALRTNPMVFTHHWRRFDYHCMAALAALWFGVHPMRVEVVAWVSGMRYALATSFVLAALIGYCMLNLRARTGMDRRRGLRWVSLAYVLSLLSFPIALPLPAVFLLLDAYPFDRVSLYDLRTPSWRQAWYEKRWMFGVAALCAVATAVGRTMVGSMVPWSEHGLLARLGQYVYTIAQTLHHTIILDNYAPLYAFETASPWFPTWASIGGLLVVAVTYGAWRMNKRWPALTVMWGCYLLFLLPVSGLSHSGAQAVADRYSYLAVLPIAMAVAMLVLWGWQQSRARGAVIAPVLVALLCVGSVSTLTVRTGQWLPVWSNSVSFWQSATRHEPQVGLTWMNYGNALLNEGQPLAAVEAHRQAFRLDPTKSIVYYNLGRSLWRAGKPGPALAAFNQTLLLEPTHVQALISRGVVHSTRGRGDLALDDYNTAIRLQPKSAIAYLNRGHIYLERQQWHEAMADYERARQTNPSLLEAYNSMGVVYLYTGRHERAIDVFQRILQVRPDYKRARRNLQVAQSEYQPTQ